MVKSRPTVILGIDPGSRVVGYGAVRAGRGAEEFLRAGVLTTRQQKEEEALREMGEQFKNVIRELKPSIVAIERLYFAKNKKTALHVAQTRGVILALAAAHGIPVHEYSPNEVKAGIAGYGFADKKAVLKMVTHILKLPARAPFRDDASDALALALLASRRRKSGG